MQHKATVLEILYFVSLTLVLLTSPVNAEEFEVAKSDDIYSVPDDYGKNNGEDFDTDHVSVLEDGRLFLQVNIASHHPGADKDDDFNEFNPGLGLEYHFENFFLAGGFFENSIDNFSTYWGAGHEREVLVDWFGMGVIGGIVTGYDDDDFSPRLAAVPYIYLKTGGTSLKTYYVPAVGDVKEDAIGFAMRFDLGGLF